MFGLSQFRKLITTAIVATALLSNNWLCDVISASPPLDELEQIAFQSATRVAQDCVVQVETFGGQEIVNQQVVASGPSSGTVLTADGWIVTSTIQFRGQPASITVVLPDEQRKAAKLVARDYSRELALLKIDVDKPLSFATPSSRKSWQVGQWVMALGKTFDVQSASCSVGILSAMGRIWDKAIQTDAKISPQNYGGPLVDLSGRVIGILTPVNPGIVTEGEVEQWYDSGIGFAIPLEDILERLPQMQRGDDVHPGRAGFMIPSVDDFSENVVLGGVSPGTPAAKAGLMAGDKIVAAGRSRDRLMPIVMHSHLKQAMGPVDADQTLVVEVERDGKRLQFECKLVKELPIYREPYLGVIIDPASPPDLPHVVHVIPDSPAAKSGIVVGDFLENVNELKFDEKNALESRLSFLDYREPAAFVIRNADGKTRSVSITLSPYPENDVTLGPVSLDTAAVPANAVKIDTALLGTVQLPLGDVKNKAFAIVPSNYLETVPHGLLLIYGEAGPQDQKQWTDAWETFAREHRWIIVVAQSADEKGWSYDEVEIGTRLRAYIMKTYSIDRRRIAMAGIASGSLLSFISVMQAPESYRALWLSSPKIPPRVKLPRSEPFKAIHFFISGADKSLDTLSEAANAAGFSSTRVAEDSKPTSLNGSLVIPRLQRWLQLLEAY